MNMHEPPDDDRHALHARIAALEAQLAREQALLQELRNREAALESILTSAPFGVATAPLNGPLNKVNPRFEEIIGYSLDELRAMPMRLLTPPDDLLREQVLIGELLTGERNHYVIEKRYIHKDGSLIPVRLVGLLARDAHGRPVQGVAIVEAIGEQLRMTDALRRSEARYRSLVEDQLDMVLRWRPDGVRVYVNDAYCRFFGQSREELIGKPIGAYTNTADLTTAQDALRRLCPAAPGAIVASRVQRADGRWIWTEWNVRGFFDAEERLVELQAVGRDISARREAEATRDALVMVLEASPDWIAYLDRGGQIRYLNRTARQLVADPAIVYKTNLHVAELLPITVWQMLWETAIPAACRDDTWQGEVTLYDAANEEFPVLLTILALHDDHGDVERLALIAHDLREQKRIAAERLALERRLLDAQKLESLGLLAGGIAHDFNNILTAILGHTDLALADAHLTPETRRSLEIVMTGVQRAAELTGAILAYAGKGRLSLEPVQINTILRELTDLLIVSALRHCTMRLELAPDLPAIQADPAQIRQMLLNLLVNAAEAIDPTGGVIRVRTRTRIMGPADVAGLPFAEQLAPGRYVELFLDDTGSGMDQATLNRIFDPFFTTKFTGRGMGLAAVQGIMRAHRGTLRVRSTVGVGTQFELWLPAITPVGIAAPATHAAHDPALTGRVLVIDDEVDVLTVVDQMLRQLGFDVLTAVSGRDALALLGVGTGPLACVLIDLTMPQMRGDAVAAAIRRDYPDLPLVLMSGYSAEAHLPIDTRTPYIQKPFTLAELQALMTQVLHRGADHEWA